MRVIAEQLGHRNPSDRRTYAHVVPETQRDAVRLLDQEGRGRMSERCVTPIGLPPDGPDGDCEQRVHGRRTPSTVPPCAGCERRWRVRVWCRSQHRRAWRRILPCDAPDTVDRTVVLIQPDGATIAAAADKCREALG